ncbi:WD40-repeat-containing domain protein [Dipodascopsis tothii]|uniref:WD40-repeat-containing domain protein n=1 Tax=Dipodascopsis tothii TaxID=44089 RepID=UPI0034CF12D1
MEARDLLTFIGGNRHPGCADHDVGTGCIAFAADRYVALWRPQDPSGVHQLLKGHNDKVTTVKYVGGASREPCRGAIVSGGVDGEIIVWKDDTVSQRLGGHERAITVLASDGDLFAAGSVDGVVSIWRLAGGTATSAQTLRLARGFMPLALALGSVRGRTVLAIGGSQTTIALYVEGADGVLASAGVLRGHEDWVRSLAFRKAGLDQLVLASASQDRYIRLWNLLPATAYSADSESRLVLAYPMLSNAIERVTVEADDDYVVVFDALLMGHDDWVFSVQWHPTEARLLSSSADTSLMIWAPDTLSGIWVPETRLGDVSIKGASSATGASGGFWTALWDRIDASWVATLGKSGSWRLWTADNGWTAFPGISGHVQAATGLAWAPGGEYLLTTSRDQTTRLLAEWRADGAGWHEFARPQIHGYDMVGVATLGPARFVSAGEEKILRVFDEPRGVAGLLARACRVAAPADRPAAATVPALGLSNKAGRDDDAVDELAQLDGPPLEAQLQRHTLYPEAEKLYGHGYEISAFAASHDGRLLATACRASSLEHAVVRIFDTTTWLELRPALAAHTLTVTALVFSPDDAWLLSVSRDRQLVLWERTTEAPFYKLAHQPPRPHTRIIWDAAWAPATLGPVFVTASRDKTLKIWTVRDGAVALLATERLPAPVTAVDVVLAGADALVAAGLDDGGVHVFRLADPTVGLKSLFVLSAPRSPSRGITRVAWRPESELPTLAVASEDTSVRVYELATI